MNRELVTLPAEQAIDYSHNGTLRDFVEHVENNGRVSYDELGDFLSAQLEPKEHGRAKPLMYTAALFASSVALSSTVEIHRDHFPTLGTLPESADTVLNNMYAIYPFGSGAANSDTLREHIPKLYLGAAISAATIEFWRLFNERRNQRQLRIRAVEAQHKLADQEAQGNIQWQIAEGATVAFVGAGDPLTQDLARDRTGDVVQIGFERPAEGAWTYLPRITTYQAVLEALDNANFENAGELLIMPTKTLDVFLPHDGDHDISLDRTVNYIRAAAEYCDRRGIPQKPVLVVGNENQSETYTSRESAEESGTSVTVTLKERMDWLSERLSCDGNTCKIETLDPTRVVMEKIAGIAGNHPIIFRATAGSQEMYGKAFYEQYKKYAVPCDPDLRPLVVTYNNNDWPTAGHAEPSDIAVIIDSSQKEGLLKMGTEHVLVVSELTLKAAKPIIHPETIS